MKMDITGKWSISNAAACLDASALAYTAAPHWHTSRVHAVLVECDNADILAFRGTALNDDAHGLKVVEDFITDARFAFTYTPFGRVHAGFWDSWQEVKADLTAWKPQRPVFITGHSLGGAQAILAAHGLSTRMDIVGVFTYGQPRVGDAAWRDNYCETQCQSECDGESRLGCRTWRLINAVDIVPRNPPWSLGYRRSAADAVMPAVGRMTFNPSLPRLLYYDTLAIASDAHDRRLGLLADHHVTNYKSRLAVEIAAQSADALARAVVEPG